MRAVPRKNYPFWQFSNFRATPVFYAQTFCYVSTSEIYVGFEVLRTAIGYSRIRSHLGLRDDFEIYARGTRVLSATLEKILTPTGYHVRKSRVAQIKGQAFANITEKQTFRTTLTVHRNLNPRKTTSTRG